MPRPKSFVPAYTLHAATGQAVVRVRLPDGRQKDLYLGKHGSAASRAEYARVIALVAANNGVYPAATADLAVNQLLLGYLTHATTYYRDADGRPTLEVERVKLALRPVRVLFGHTPAADFGPKALKAVRDRMVGEGLCRKTVNIRVGVIKKAFRWAVSEELIPAATYQALAAVEGLRAGRTAAPDKPPVRPANPESVAKAVAVMPPIPAAVAELQALSAARAGELLGMKAADVDRSGEVWTYTPKQHKGAWRGRHRVLYFGRRAREVLAPLLDACPPDGYVFSPARQEAARLEAVSAARQTPRWPSHMARNATKRAKATGRRTPGERYTTTSYRRAIVRACVRADVPVFTPHQLRHLAATRIRAELGLEVARAVLGHSMAAMTDHYSKEVDAALALKAVERLG